MEFLICEKHGKGQKNINKLNTNAYTCLNRYCPESFKVLCASCKMDHKDHAAKILSLEDTTFLIERLMKVPFKQTNRYIGEALDIMKKLKLIKEFRKKIDILEKQIQKQALKLIDSTQSLTYEYNICQEGVERLEELLSNLEKGENYKQFFENSQQLLSNLDYNFKKDKFQYGNALTKEKEDKRRKTLESAKRKIEEVRDYSMKIIEVILHNNESDDQEEDVSYQKKHYQLLRNELAVEKDQNELEEEISELKNSKSTLNKSRAKKNSLDRESQTSATVYLEELTASYEEKLKQLQQQHESWQNQLKSELNSTKSQLLSAQSELASIKSEISSISSEKQNMHKQLTNWKQKYEQKRRNIKDLEVSLRDNRLQRLKKQKSRQQLINKIIDISQGRNLRDDR